MWSENDHWHYDYIRLAWDTGFSFEKCKCPDLNKNKICVVDIDKVIKERDVATVDRFIPTVIQFILDNEQAEVLDTNFVKMFRISQLSVEYLLFCKRYLDNTVSLFKKELSKFREENKELESYTKELESHIKTLTNLNHLTTFKCNKCSKVFSSEEYLNSHTKRRHSIEDGDNNVVPETVKLQSEIKDLKERLNSAEKLLCETSDNKSKENKEPDEGNTVKIKEMQQKFDTFREDIEKELYTIRQQKTFYEEKYVKLLDLVVTQHTTNNINNQTSIIEEKSDIPDKVEHTTQTEPVVLKKENIQDNHIFDFQEINELSKVSTEISKNEVTTKTNITSEIEEKINQFELTVEGKISATLQNIEGQMQAFWNKLNEVNTYKQVNQNVENESKPPIKPRSKFSQPTKITEVNTEQINRLRPEIEKLEAKEQATIEVKFTNDADLFSSSDLSVSEHIEEPAIPIKRKPKLTKKPSVSGLSKPSLSPQEIKCDKEVVDKLKEEVETIISTRLQEVGVSPFWKTLPDKSYAKIMDIINHQANLTSKTYPNFGKIKSDIQRSLEIVDNKSIPTKDRNKHLHAIKTEKSQNIIHIGYRKKPRSPLKTEHKVPELEKVSIRNRSLYDTTDTDSENLVAPTKNVEQTVAVVTPEKKFSAVVEELILSGHIHAGNDKDNKGNKIPTKGVLKNYPSLGTLSKKKVLFNIDSDSSKAEDVPMVQILEGSTTSVASSILDGKQENERNESNKSEKVKKDDIESVSDFDLSEL